MSKPVFSVIVPANFFDENSKGFEVQVVAGGRGGWVLESASFGTLDLVGFEGEFDVTVKYTGLSRGGLSIAALLANVDSQIIAVTNNSYRKVTTPVEDARALESWLNNRLGEYLG